MLRARSVEIVFPTRAIMTVVIESLIVQELAIQQELTELHDARANLDYLSFGEDDGPSLSQCIDEHMGVLKAVREALVWVRGCCPVFLLGDIEHVE